MTLKRAVFIFHFLLAFIGFAFAEGDERVFSTDYPPMKPFERFAGKTWRGEGVDPEGRTVADVAVWGFILGGRAFQSTHRLEDGSYGGTTIFFYDERADKYVFHYFTTAGFHTMGEAIPTERGFDTVEKVLGHPEFEKVIAAVIFEGDVVQIQTRHIHKDGKETKSGFVYRQIESTGPLFGVDTE